MPENTELYTYIIQTNGEVSDWTAVNNVVFNAQIASLSNVSLDTLQFGAVIAGDQPDFNANGIKIIITEENQS